MSALNATEAAELFRAEPHQYIDVGDGEVAYRKIGQGPDVLFSHGWPVTSATFRYLLPYLVDHVTCHLFDYVGAGDSRFDRTATLSVEGHAKALRRVVDTLGLERFGVVGHDSGGMIARFALAGDERVHGWGLVATEQPPKPSWRFHAFVNLRVLPGFPSLLGLAMNTPWMRRNPFVLGDIFADRSRLDGDFAEFFAEPLRDDPEKLWAAAELLRNFDLGLFAKLSEAHRKITAPVQLVWGGRDRFFPVDRARAMMPEFAGPVDLEVVDDASLFLHEEFPGPVANALLKTIRGA